MAVPQYQVLSSTNVGRKGNLLRIRPTLEKNLRLPCGTVVTVPYINEPRVSGVTDYWYAAPGSQKIITRSRSSLPGNRSMHSISS